jgi:hypothetical protein
MMQVLEMKSSSMSISICKRNVTAEQATWLSITEQEKVGIKLE